MRLHRLEITAFGPFARPQHIDFDDLGDAGLFLLHGPTGAGKTSVLDAICFALYGRVPGSRGNGGRFRSDHADPGARTEVVCEFTVSGRRLEITRSPEWHRPKKRGTGLTREQARVVVRERTAEGWTGLTHRMDEAGDLIGQLVGLGPEQFTKIVMLPQGEFAAFLRASAEERRPLLQKLFGTDRFAAVETWLAERRRESAGAVASAREETARLLARAQEAHLTPSSAGDPDPADPEAVAVLVRGWADDARAGLLDAHAAVMAAETAHDRARAASEAAAERVRRRDRRRDLAAEHDLLLSQAGMQDERRARLRAAGHAPVLLPLLAEFDAASAEVETAEFRVDSADRAVTHAVGDAGDHDPGRLRQELGVLAALLPAELELRRLDRRATLLRETQDTAETEREQAEQAGAVLTGRVQELLAARSEGEVLASSLIDRQEDLERAKRVAEAVLAVQRLTDEQAVLEDELRAATDVHQAAVAASQELQARRLAGMAAELAAGLSPGTACPVCGGEEHPRPATHEGPAITDDEQEEAAGAVELAASRREEARQAVEAGRQQLAAAQALAGGADAEAAMEELSGAQTRLTEAGRGAARVRKLTTELAGLESELESARKRLELATGATADAREELAALDSRRDDLRERLDKACGGEADLPSRHARVAAAVAALTEQEEAGRALSAAQERLNRARAAADRASSAAGFTDRRAAAAAALPEAERTTLTELITEHDAQLARVTALLEETAEDVDPENSQDDEADRTRMSLQAARAAHRTAQERHVLATRAARALAGLAGDLERHAASTSSLRGSFATLESVSRCAEGTGGDNQLKMRLSSYVLAARLEQVAGAASVRLTAMSGGRYSLVHTDGPARGGARSGLGLAVVDGWTGSQRDPASLSGGETFCTSLALALGLADVVQAEAGGAVIETLLVDEGFGSLDQDTLDEVMDVLDGLRAGGRVVGLVSHVADLRDRIPAQLEVVKTRTGSTLVA
ncbi:SMC family ATPase [Kineosporia sp. J2-2]|uniref:Nuclease SbcCD subunit C n=1 Tax=Kineosporia corallincola TaxID=2835133 RepID=A0ABS5TMZ2_9ACTN|nr:SMC family ATPase [Kineosporia corallincola]MBT0772462.1 SMC family ATPase [Kineosporia corallincola]